MKYKALMVIVMSFCESCTASQPLQTDQPSTYEEVLKAAFAKKAQYQEHRKRQKEQEIIAFEQAKNEQLRLEIVVRTWLQGCTLPYGLNNFASAVPATCKPQPRAVDRKVGARTPLPEGPAVVLGLKHKKFPNQESLSL